MRVPIHPAAPRTGRLSINLFDERPPHASSSGSFHCEQVLQIADRSQRNSAAMKQEMREAKQLIPLLRYQRVHRFVSIEEARPGHACDGIWQRGLPFAAVERVVSIP